jgi:hypothetical protein
MVNLISSNGWNVPTKQMENHSRTWVYEGYRTIEANSINDALEYMEKHYTGIKDDVFNEKSLHWYNDSHRIDGKHYSFIVFKIRL